jgi:hypothetical protein
VCRHIYGLKWARELSDWPLGIPRNRPRGQKALGRRYEVAVGKQLGKQAIGGKWWEYKDLNGTGLCQTDYMLVGKTWIVVLECKHTWTDEGLEQLQFLYIPVVEAVKKMPVLGVQVCKNLTPGAVGPVFNDLAEAIKDAKNGGLVTLHWSGIGPMFYSGKEHHNG